MKKHISYTVKIEPSEDGGYVASIPALNDIATQGETYEEALTNARDLIEGYLAVLAEDGEPIPLENPNTATTIIEVKIDNLARV